MINILIAWMAYAIILHLEMNSTLDETLESDVDYLIILGSLLQNNEVGKVLHSRLEKGVQLLNENPNLKIIVTGGRRKNGELTEAQAMKKVLVTEFHVPEQQIMMEDLSKNTFENLLFCKSLINDKKVGIITSEFHTMRVKLLAYRLKVNSQVIGSKTEGLKRYKWECREHLALIKSLFIDH